MPEPRTVTAESEGAPLAPHTVHPGRESLDDGVRILKHGDTFAVFDRHGDAHAGRSSHGIYHDGTRHLSHLILEIAGDRPLLLKSTISPDNLLLAIDLTNPDLTEGGIAEADTVHLFRGRVVRDAVVHERVRLTNHGMGSVSFPLTWRFGADFVDVSRCAACSGRGAASASTPRCAPTASGSATAGSTASSGAPICCARRPRTG